MNCPKCKTPAGENDLVCSKCKKVLRLQCPNCSAVTKNTTCEKCGTVILNKCYKCGKLNSTTLEKCPACGLNVNASIGLKESIIEEFAVLTIEITNFEDIKAAFQSEKLTQKFKNNLYEMIKKNALQKKLRVQFLNDTFIIRFCKDYSFVESAKSAIDFSIFVAQSVTEINRKLYEAKGIAIKAQMAVQKRDVYSKPQDYKSGININVVYSSNRNSHLFNNVEVIADSYIYQAVKINYPFQSLSAVYIKKQMVMFFELILHAIIRLEKKEELDINNVKLPKNIDYEPEEDAETEALINFSSLNCTFLRANNYNLLNELQKIIAQKIENPIISVRGNYLSGKLSLISTEELEKTLPDYKIVRFTCPLKNKYDAYGLFKHMILAYKGISEINLLLNPELVEVASQDPAIQNLFKMETAGFPHPEDFRFTYYEAFTNFIAALPFKTIFVIDDFENVDESSLEIIKYLSETRNLKNAGFLVSCAADYMLHRKIYRLMTSGNYFEVELRPVANKTIVKNNLKQLKDIENSFYYEKILENTKGSLAYFNEALSYLIDDKVLEFKNEKYEIKQDRMVVLSKNFDELIQKRILHLETIPNALDLFSALLFLGQNVPLFIIRMLEIKDDTKILKYLETQNFIKILNDKDIFVNNINLFRKNLIPSLEKERITEIGQNLIIKIYSKINIINNTKAELLELAGLKKEAFSEWHSLSLTANQMGDFCAYLNNTNKFLSQVDNVIDPETDKTVEEVKMDVYGELASMLYKYYPDKILNFLELLLENLEKQKDDHKIKEVANKLVQSCLISGNYNNALEYIGKIISRTPRSSFNPKDKDFNLNYFLVNIVTLEIYYNLGRLNECIELGDELFKDIDISTLAENILPEGFSKKQFEDALLDALFFIGVSRIIQLKPDMKAKTEKLAQIAPESYSCFKLLLLLIKHFEGEDIIPELTVIAQQGLKDKYSNILFPILQGLIAFRYQDWNNVGNYVYNAKIQASSLHLHQIEYFCDLIIGYAYEKLGSSKKAKQIFYNILDLSTEKGLKNIMYLSWLFIAKTEYLDDNKEVAVEILNNSILNMENDSNVTDFFIMTFKTLSAEIMIQQNNIEQALFCAEQAFDIAHKNKLNLYLPQIADILIFVYNKITASAESLEIIESFQRKAEKLNQMMSNFMNTK